MQHSEPRPPNRRHPTPVALAAATLLTALAAGTQAQTAVPANPLAQGTAPAAAPGFPAPAVPAAGVASAPVQGQPAAPLAVPGPQAMVPAPGVAPVAPGAAAPPAGTAPPPAPLAGTSPVQPFPGATMGAPGYNAAVPQPVRPGAMPQPARPAFAAPPLPTVQSPPVKGLPADAPKLVINGGVHSPNPARRRVIVNGQVVREGADLGAGVVLEQIKPDSVVLGFRGEHFHVMY